MGRFFKWLNSLLFSEPTDEDIEKRFAESNNSKESEAEIESKTDDVPIITEELEVTEEEKEDVVEEGYWWEHQEYEEQKEVKFSNLPVEDIYEALEKSIEANKVELIEIPDHVLKVINLMGDAEFSYEEVAGAIEKTPAIAGEFLKAVNSVSFNRGLHISNLRVALPRLGKSVVKSILYLNTAQVNIPGSEIFKEMANDIIQHSLAVGKIAEYLCPRFYNDTNLAYLGGMMHDIGKLSIILEVSKMFEVPEDFNEAFKNHMSKNVFPDFHEITGEMLGQHWNLEEEVVVSIRNHHDFAVMERLNSNDTNYDLCAVVSLADTFACLMGFGQQVKVDNIWEHPGCERLDIIESPINIQLFEGIPKLFEEE